MSLNDTIERLSILVKLVDKYCQTNIRTTIKLAIDLDDTLNCLYHNGIGLEDLLSINENLYAEHFQQKSKFLSIIAKYWSQITASFGHCSVDANTFQIQQDQSLWSQSDMRYTNYLNNELSNDINIIKFNNEYTEVGYVVDYIIDHKANKIIVICPNEKLSKLIYIKLKNEHINFTSRVKKEYEDIADDFKRQVKHYFGYLDKQSIKQVIKELSFLDTTQYDSTINIVDLDNTSVDLFDRSHSIICMSMEQEYWTNKNKGEYWLSSNLQSKLNLTVENRLENLFCSIIKQKAKIYLVYSNKVNGKPAVKSNILMQFEMFAKRFGTKINYLEHSSNQISSSSNNDYGTYKPIISQVLYTSDLSNILYNFESYYINKILELKSTDSNKETFDLTNNFKEVLYSYFDDNKNISYYLDNVKHINYLYYIKFKQIINWLNRNQRRCSYSINNKLLEAWIPTLGLTMKGYCDRLELNQGVVRLIQYQLSKPTSMRSILSGKESTLLSQAAILKYNNLIDFDEVVFEVWNPNWYGRQPVEIAEIRISKLLINKYLDNVKNVIENYRMSDKISLSESINEPLDCYKHFERRGI